MDVLNDINELRKEKAELQEQLAALTGEAHPTIENLAGLDEVYEVSGEYKEMGWSKRRWNAKATWGEIFGTISPYLVEHPNDLLVKSTLTPTLFKRCLEGKNSSSTEHLSLDDQVFRTIAVQLTALGLMSINYSEAVGGGMGRFWSLTAAGERLMFELRTVRTKAVSGEA